MKVIVKYADYSEVIDQMEIPMGEDTREILRVVEVTEEEGTKKVVQMDIVDDSISHTVTQTLDYNDLRDYIQVLQQLSIQIR